jgi:hypothetical protein
MGRHGNLRVQVLGALAVAVDGREVPAHRLASRKGRTLLKLLLARRVEVDLDEAERLAGEARLGGEPALALAAANAAGSYANRDADRLLGPATTGTHPGLHAQLALAECALVAATGSDYLLAQVAPPPRGSGGNRAHRGRPAARAPPGVPGARPGGRRHRLTPIFAQRLAAQASAVR